MLQNKQKDKTLNIDILETLLLRYVLVISSFYVCISYIFVGWNCTLS